MSNEPFNPAETPEAALKAARFVWGFSLLSLMVFAVIAMTMRGLNGVTEDGDGFASLGSVLIPAVWGLLVVAVSVAFFLRNQTYKKHWQEDAVTPQGYFLGNVIFFSAVEFPAMIAAMAVFLGVNLLAGLLPILVTLPLLLVNFPNGRPMSPQEPRLGVSER